MKRIIKRSKDLLLFLVLFIFITIFLKNKISKNDILNYMLSNNYYKSNHKISNKLPLMYNLYSYNLDEKVFKEVKNIYIFNTHYEEEYLDTNVIEMSKLLSEKLNKEGINTIFEDTDYKEYVITNKLLGINNYIMIRPIISKRIENKDISLVIDLHRDSIRKDQSVITINNKKYAKVLFVVDNYYKDYLNKYDFCKHLNNYLDTNYKGISRGIYVKYGGGFNQDLNEHMILLELGGYQNSKEELVNTLDVIVDMIKENI